VTIDAASPAPVNVPALNKAFTSELITVSAGRTQTTSWCDGGGCETTYSDGVESTNTVLTEPDATDPNAQIGSVLFRVGNGPWTEITSPATVVPAGRPVELAYNDVSGAFDDNSGHYTVTIVRNR
jgi:hypothetical protein